MAAADGSAPPAGVALPSGSGQVGGPAAGGAVLAPDTAQPFPNGYTWQQVAAAIDADPLMKPAGAIVDHNEIFGLPLQSVAEVAAEPAVEQPPPARLTPSEAGLVLSSTVVGPGGRVALISGRRYRVGDNVKSAKEGQPIVFKLIAVEPRQIILETDGDRYLVKMPGARLANDDSVE